MEMECAKIITKIKIKTLKLITKITSENVQHNVRHISRNDRKDIITIK